MYWQRKCHMCCRSMTYELSFRNKVDFITVYDNLFCQSNLISSKELWDWRSWFAERHCTVKRQPLCLFTLQLWRNLNVLRGKSLTAKFLSLSLFLSLTLLFLYLSHTFSLSQSHTSHNHRRSRITTANNSNNNDNISINNNNNIYNSTFYWS